LRGYLLDTNVALLAVSAPEALSPQILEAIQRGPAFLSVISYWEVTIKSMKGTLDASDPIAWFDQTRDALSLLPLLLRPQHVAALAGLPFVHRDPFDRILIAQAISEKLTLLTTDATIPGYASAGLHAIG
jgi:PIN domain nuclease of toxin-antitoxin system